MKKKQVWISETLYQEILRAQESLRITEQKIKTKGQKKKTISFLHTTDQLAKYLNTLRNKK